MKKYFNGRVAAAVAVSKHLFTAVWTINVHRVTNNFLVL